MEKKEVIQSEIAKVLEKMGYASKIEVFDEKESVFVKISVEDGSKILIGQHGVALSALQYIARSIVSRKLEDRIDIVIDVNGYLEEKKPFLEREALESEETALRTGRPVTLRPMFPYERKVVHTFLANRGKVLTESTGRGEDRKIIIKPAPQVVV